MEMEKGRGNGEGGKRRGKVDGFVLRFNLLMQQLLLSLSLPTLLPVPLFPAPPPPFLVDTLSARRGKQMNKLSFPVPSLPPQRGHAFNFIALLR